MVLLKSMGNCFLQLVTDHEQVVHIQQPLGAQNRGGVQVASHPLRALQKKKKKEKKTRGFLPTITTGYFIPPRANGGLELMNDDVRKFPSFPVAHYNEARQHLYS